MKLTKPKINHNHKNMSQASKKFKIRKEKELNNNNFTKNQVNKKVVQVTTYMRINKANK